MVEHAAGKDDGIDGRGGPRGYRSRLDCSKQKTAVGIGPRTAESSKAARTVWEAPPVIGLPDLDHGIGYRVAVAVQDPSRDPDREPRRVVVDQVVAD